MANYGAKSLASFDRTTLHRGRRIHRMREFIQAADEESEDVDELSNIGDGDSDVSDQSDYASDRDY